MGMRRSIKIGIILVSVTVAVWILRFTLYPFKSKTAVLPNGTVVHARLADVRRVEPGRVRISMDLSWKDTRSDTVFVPDMTVTRPLAVQIPRSPASDALTDGMAVVTDQTERSNSDTNCDNGAVSTAYFDLKSPGSTIDITQSLYCIASRDIVHVELPLVAHSIRQFDTGRVEILALGKGTGYTSGTWRPVEGDVRLPSDAFCVRVKQDDCNGSLMPWTISAIGSTGREGHDSCSAELVDNRGHSIRMSASYVAYRDCRRCECITDLNPPLVKLKRRAIQAISLGHILITGGVSTQETVDVPGNGEWIYVFSIKDPSKYSKLRIKYILPPKPKDQVTIRFDRVPI